MKISVITPSWNQGRFLKRCLESIKSTPQVEVEHIVLDNCSTDETAELLAAYSTLDDGVSRRFITKKDKGQTQAINEGFSLATGDIVCWLNTDEWYESGALNAVAEAFNNDSSIDVLYGNCNFVDVNGQTVKRRKSFSFSPSMLLYYGCYISSCATFIRRKVVDEQELLNAEFKVAMDYEYYVRLHARGYKFKYLARPLANFTWHETNISHQHKDRSREERLLIQSRFSALPGPDMLRRPIFSALAVAWRCVRGAKRLAGQQ